MLLMVARTALNAAVTSPLMVDRADFRKFSMPVTMFFQPWTSVFHQLLSQEWIAFHPALMSPKIVFHAIFSGLAGQVRAAWRSGASARLMRALTPGP
jgi:hypothetical protein